MFSTVKNKKKEKREKRKIYTNNRESTRVNREKGPGRVRRPENIPFAVTYCWSFFNRAAIRIPTLGVHNSHRRTFEYDQIRVNVGVLVNRSVARAIFSFSFSFFHTVRAMYTANAKFRAINAWRARCA